MSWLASFSATAIRELNGIRSSRQIVIFCFIIPVIWILIIWGLLGQGVVTHVPVAFIDQDKSPMSRELERAVSSVRGIGLETYLSPGEALKALQEGEVYGVLLVPFGYARESLSGTGGTVSLWLNENRYAAAGIIQAGVENAVKGVVLKDTYTSALKTGIGQANAKRIISVVRADFYEMGNAETSFLAFLGSTLIPSLIMIAVMLGCLTAFLRELWDKSINDWLECANNNIGAAVFGKLLPWYSMYALIALFYMILFSAEGGFTITGSLLSWFSLFMLCMADFAAMAVLVAAIAPTWRMALVIGAGYSAPALPYTGFSIPLDSMSQAARTFGECLPLTWFVQGQALNWTLGASIADLHIPLLAMCVLMIIPLCLGLPLIKFSYRRYALKEDKSSK